MAAPRSRASLNPERGQMLVRHLGRVKTLRIAVQRANERGLHQRADSLQKELDYRLGELASIKSILDDV